MSYPFVFCSLWFPRWTLLLCYLFSGLPPNDTPFGIDLVGAIFAPRLLIAWWLWEASWHPIWPAIFVFLTLCEWLGGSSTATKMKKKKA